MANQSKILIQRLLRKLGYKVIKINNSDLSSYTKYDLNSLQNKLFYNVGAGAFCHPYWTNIDYGSAAYDDVQGEGGYIEHDLMQCGQLPIKSNTVEILYSSHTIEHVSDDAVEALLKDSYRCLKEGGVIRLTTPNVELNYAAYTLNDRSYYYFADMHSVQGSYENKFAIPYNKFTIPQLFLHQIAGQLSVNDIREGGSGIKFKDDEIIEVLQTNSLEDACDFFTKKCFFDKRQANNHINWFSYDKLHQMLLNAGFTTVYRSGYGQSHIGVLRNTDYFDNTHPKISLYVEAVKS